MKKHTLKAIIITTIILLIHFLLSILIVYCNNKIYIGFLGDIGNRIVCLLFFYFPITVITNLYHEITGPGLSFNHDFKCPRWMKTGLILGCILLAILMVSYILGVLWDDIHANPFLYGNYIGGIYVVVRLVLLPIFFKQDTRMDAHIFFSLWALFSDGISICVFIVMVIVVRPVSYHQAYDIAAKSGLSAPELQNHGDKSDFNSYFGEWDLNRIDMQIYEKNNMRIIPSDLLPDEDKLGYYFFAGEKNGEPWGIAISGKTGRIIKEISIEDPFLDPAPSE